ncbi:hypothetical protein BT69DRAFT_329700 [Atractiella rhizophila]|nr:hypothetical protein BT69DRAFT_329700 [Atractiella rhizophila]
MGQLVLFFFIFFLVPHPARSFPQAPPGVPSQLSSEFGPPAAPSHSNSGSTTLPANGGGDPLTTIPNPSTAPSTNPPSTFPAGGGGTLPSTNPSTLPTFPVGGGTLPSTLPSTPSTGAPGGPTNGPINTGQGSAVSLTGTTPIVLPTVVDGSTFLQTLQPTVLGGTTTFLPVSQTVVNGQTVLLTLSPTVVDGSTTYIPIATGQLQGSSGAAGWRVSSASGGCLGKFLGENG